jgi:hypothetical protein
MLFGVSDFAGALIKFKSSYSASKDARLLWQMAACEGKLHHYARALGLMGQYLKDGGNLLTDQDRTDAGAAIKAMEPLTSAVVVKVNEADADVSVDGEVVGKTPLADAVRVDIGEHKIAVHKDGFHDFTKDVTVTGSNQVPVDAQLAPITHQAHVSVHAGPRNAIFFDGEPVGVGSYTGVVKSGDHQLRVTGEGMQPYQTEVLLQDDDTRNVEVTLIPEKGGGLPAWAWIVGGVVVAGGLGTGAYFLFQPKSTYTGPTGNFGPGVVQASASPGFHF